MIILVSFIYLVLVHYLSAIRDELKKINKQLRERD